jgi:FKBP-type peptidyl-prolyl cis-trans isomerase 2
MRTAQLGDRVRVHYVKRGANGGVSSSRGGPPLEMTVGTDHQRLPGLGTALVGRGEGEPVRVHVPAEQAHGLPRPERVRRLPRSRFPSGSELAVGSRLYVAGRTRRRLVRIVDVLDDAVVVDANHPWAGQAVSLDVRIVAFADPGAASAAPESTGGR